LIDFAALNLDRATLIAASPRKASAPRSIIFRSIASLTTRPQVRRRVCLAPTNTIAGCLSLPLFPAMSTDDVARVACALKRAVKLDLLVDRVRPRLRLAQSIAPCATPARPDT